MNGLRHHNRNTWSEQDLERRQANRTVAVLLTIAGTVIGIFIIYLGRWSGWWQ